MLPQSDCLRRIPITKFELSGDFLNNNNTDIIRSKNKLIIDKKSAPGNRSTLKRIAIAAIDNVIPEAIAISILLTPML